MNFLDRISSLFGNNGGYTGTPNVIDISSAKSINPYVLDRYQAGAISADELYQILTKGNVDEWKKAAVNNSMPVPTQVPDNLGVGFGEEAPGKTWYPSGYKPQPLDPTDRGWEGSPTQELSKQMFGYSAQAQAPQVLGAQSSGGLQKVKDYITKGYPGSRITPEYYDALAAGLDQDTLLRVLAMSIAETGAGRDASSFKGDGSLKKNNYYGYHKGGNQYDPDLPTMIQDLNTAFGPGGRYSTINKETLSWYVKGKSWDSLDAAQQQSVLDELGRYNWARKQFGM